MAIIRIFKWMSACDDNGIFFAHEIPRWTTTVATIGPCIRVCHHKMCVIIPVQFIDYQKVILDKGAFTIMQIKEVAWWSNRGNL